MPQDTRVPTAREQMVRDYAPMTAAQIQHGFERWGADVEVDGDELARIRLSTAGGER